MKALTVAQPVASLVASGAWGALTRSVDTAHRGWLAIHASSKLPLEMLAACSQEPCRRVLAAAGYPSPAALPLGAVVGVARLVNCLRIDMSMRLPAEPERSLGEWREGRWAWLLMEPILLPRPVAATGACELWEWRAPDWVMEMLRWRL